jgi:hypothetical protein
VSRPPNEVIRDISAYIAQHGLDPVPVSEPVIFKHDADRLIIETYSWGRVYAAHRAGRAFRWTGNLRLLRAAMWVRRLDAASQGPSRMHRRNRAGQRANVGAQASTTAAGGGKDAKALAERIARLIASKAGVDLARSQGAAKDGQMFLRDHYDTSQYLSLFVRQGERFNKIAQLWPLKSGLVNVQLFGCSARHLRKVPDVYAIVEWKDVRKDPTPVVLQIGDTGASYVARGVVAALESADVL